MRRLNQSKKRKFNMARPKKDGAYINYYVDRELVKKLRDYAEDKGQTMTTALERILRDYLERSESPAEKNVDSRK